MRIVQVKSRHPQTAGWYVTDSDVPPSLWTWNDYGNGPEIFSPTAYGPFATKAKAERYAREREADIIAEEAAAERFIADYMAEVAD